MSTASFIRRAACLALLWGAGCSSSLPAALLSVEPEVLSTSGGPLRLEGRGLLPAGSWDFDRPQASGWDTAVTATLIRGDVTVELQDATWESPTTVLATVPAGVAHGRWTVTVTTARGVHLSLEDALEIQPDDAGQLTDAGEPDGGVPDAGQRDAGAPDAGRDGGSPTDAGPPPDAGVVDAGPIDAGCRSLTFADDDGDGYGALGSAALQCGPGRSLITGDCDDVDALTSPDANEICNDIDDNCDGLTDEGPACVLTPDLLPLPTVTGGALGYVTASAWKPMELYAAGDHVLVASAGDGGLELTPSGCPMNLRATWADPTGRLFIAGGNNGIGRMATASLLGCGSSVMLSEPVAGLVGFELPDGGAEVTVVERSGAWSRWDGVGAVQTIRAGISGVELLDAHGATPNVIYAVGNASGLPAVVRLSLDGGVQRETLPPGLTGSLRGVWASSETEVAAVGDVGLTVRRLSDGRWVQIAAPTASPDTHSSVRAFTPGRLYVSTTGGEVWMWTGRGWKLRYNGGGTLRDVTAVDETHLWVVGDNGVIIRGPFP